MVDYRTLGYEAASDGLYENSEDAWESEESHYSLSHDEKEIAVSDFSDGWVAWFSEHPAISIYN